MGPVTYKAEPKVDDNLKSSCFTSTYKIGGLSQNVVRKGIIKAFGESSMYMNQGLNYQGGIQATSAMTLNARKQAFLHKFKSQIRDFSGSIMSQRMPDYLSVNDRTVLFQNNSKVLS